MKDTNGLTMAQVTHKMAELIDAGYTRDDLLEMAEGYATESCSAERIVETAFKYHGRWSGEPAAA